MARHAPWPGKTGQVCWRPALPSQHARPASVKQIRAYLEAHMLRCRAAAGAKHDKVSVDLTLLPTLALVCHREGAIRIFLDPAGSRAAVSWPAMASA